MAIDWRRGYSCDWRLYRVDPRTWADAEQVGHVLSATVARSLDGEAPTMERASVEVTAARDESIGEGLYRLKAIVSQGVSRDRIDVCTMLCVSVSGGGIGDGLRPYTMSGKSILWPASVAEVDAGEYAPAGIDGAQWAADMLAGAIMAPVSVDPDASFRLDTHMVFQGGTKKIDAAWKVLRAGNCLPRVGGDGRTRVIARPTRPALEVDRAGLRMLMPDMEPELDMSGVPNAYTAVDGSDRVTYVNDDPASPTSTASRGWRHDMRDTSPVRVNGETLSAYCQRRLEEESLVEETRHYTREWSPDVFPGDVVRWTVAAIGAVGDYRVKSQQLTCGAGITVQETAAREVYAWKRS